MTDYNFEGLIGITELASVRHLAGVACATEQGIRAQIRSLQKGEKKSQDVGFEVVKGPNSGIFLKITDKKIESFRQKLIKWVKENSPKL